MNKNSLEEYILAMTGQHAVLGEEMALRVPLFIRQRYGLHALHVGGRRFLGIRPHTGEAFRPATFEKHLREISKAMPDMTGYCVITSGLAGYVRRRMTERGIPFVDVGRQLYWPQLGAACQKKASKAHLPSVDTLSPASQAVVMHLLSGEIRQPTSAKALSGRLGYTTMSISRCLDEIEGSGIARIERKGRERLLLPQDAATLWARALPLLQSPVRKVVRIMETQIAGERLPLAGLTALGELGRLAAPREATYAIWAKTWNGRFQKTESIPIEDEGTCLVELWRYDPQLFSPSGVVNPFPLYLSLKGNPDERIEKALEELIENASKGTRT